MDIKNVVKSTASIMIIIMLSKLIGFFREILIAAKFGSGNVTDAYFIANTACTIIIGVIAYALHTTLIPIFSEIIEKKKPKYELEFMNNILNITLIFTLVFLVIGWFFSPFIIRVIAKGFTGEQFNLAVKLNRLGLPMIIFMIATSVFSSFLQSNEKFAATAMTGIPFNIILIIFLTFFSKEFGISGLMIATVIATSTQLLVQIPSAYRLNYSYKPQININDKYIQKVFLLTAPMIFGAMIEKINNVIDKTLASQLVGGSISALNYASILNGLILNVFVVAITTVIFPMISRESIKKNNDSVKSIMSKGIDTILVIIMPATIGMMVLAVPIVRVLFERGVFDSTATNMTALALRYYSIGLVGYSLRDILSKVFYSLKDTKTPMINGVLTVALNIILNLIFVRYMAHVGLALATSISGIIGTIFLFLYLRKKVGSIGIRKNIACFIKTGISSGIMGIVIYFANLTFSSYFRHEFLYRSIGLFVSIILGVIVYTILCYFLKIEGVNMMVKYIINLINRKDLKAELEAIRNVVLEEIIDINHKIILGEQLFYGNLNKIDALGALIKKYKAENESFDERLSLVKKKCENNTFELNEIKSKLFQIENTIETKIDDTKIKNWRNYEKEHKPETKLKYTNAYKELEEQIIAMYADGMSVHDIQNYMKYVYGKNIPLTILSSMTDKIFRLVTEWQYRPLDKMYPIVYFNVNKIKVTHKKRIVNKILLTVLGINMSGYKKILGIWVGESESESFWLSAYSDLKTRGIEDILIACNYGIQYVFESIYSYFPEAEIQLFIKHQIKNNLKHVPYKEKREVFIGLKQILQAQTLREAELSFELFKYRWNKKYPQIIRTWEKDWKKLTAYLKYSSDIRELLFNMNLVGEYNRQIWNVLKDKTDYWTDDSLINLIYLAAMQIENRWTEPIKQWKECLLQFEK